MKISFQLRLASLCFLSEAASNVFAFVDCSAQVISRASSGNAIFSSQAPSVCEHFGGLNSQSYIDWYDSNDIPSKYPNHVYLPSSDTTNPGENGAAIHWKVDDSYVYLAVAARASGWLGFGIAEAGGMIGADMALFTSSRPDEIVDAYTNDMRMPQTDTCKSDWKLITSIVDGEGGFLMFETKRLLDTNDPQDKRIVDDSSTSIPPHRVIAAWGNTPEVGYHGPNVSRGAIRFFGNGNAQATFETAMNRHADGSFLARSINHEIAANDTEYAYTCVSRQDLIDQGVPDTDDMLNIIGFDPILSQNSEAFVHHFIVKGGQSCDDEERFIELVYVWAPGEGALSLPENLGVPLFGNDGHEAFEIEVHYNNPQLKEGIIDNSGVRLYWTSQHRDEQIGILSVGDPFVGLYGASVGNGLTMHELECPGACSSLVDQPVTVIREYLHMHQTGLRIKNEQVRDGQVVRSSAVDYWEFDQNGNAAVVQDPFEIQPGDAFKTTCYFNGDESRKFGLSSQEEMCIAFLYYYPRKKISDQLNDGTTVEIPWVCGYDLGLSSCEASYFNSSLPSAEDLHRTFGIHVDDCDIGSSASSKIFLGHAGKILILVGTLISWGSHVF